MKYIALAALVISPFVVAQETDFDAWTVDHEFNSMHTTKSSKFDHNQIYLNCGGYIRFETESEVTLGRGFSIDSSDIYPFGDLKTVEHVSGEDDGSLIKRLKAGLTLKLHELSFYGYGVQEFSLIGFTTAYNELMRHCSFRQDDEENARVQRIVSASPSTGCNLLPTVLTQQLIYGVGKLA